MQAMSSEGSERVRTTRVLACTACQHRKVRCDRKTPCGNCRKSGQPCIPASTAPRRPRFPERALLDRVRHYESLLRENGIKFQPLHSTQTVGGDSETPMRTDGGAHLSDEEVESWTSRSSTSESLWPKDMWKAVYGKTSDEWRYEDSDTSVTSSSAQKKEHEAPEDLINQAWNVLFNNNDHLVLGLRESAVGLAHLHPDPMHVFRLWQVYLDNVDPLLKVTHNSSLQARVIEAVGKLSDPKTSRGIENPPLEALMFSIYCTAVSSLGDRDCRAVFGPGRKELLRRYHLACQEALLNAGYMRTGDRDCLTAFFFYLLSAGQNVDPRALCSMVGAAVRVAQRMRLHSEAVNARFPPREAEMRRRLWWSLVLFEARISELADVKVSSLAPTWDCRIPLNVADSELGTDLQQQQQQQQQQRQQKQGDGQRCYATEAIFPVVRSAIADHIRHASFFLDATCPALKPLLSVKGRRSRTHDQGKVTAAAAEESELAILEKQIEDKYLRLCDPGNPLQYATIWMARTLMAKYRLIEYLMNHGDSNSAQTEAQRAEATAHALRILECDNMVMGAADPSRGFRWLQKYYFPLPSYLYLARELRRRPVQDLADRAWALMSENHAARYGNGDGDGEEGWSPVVGFFANMVIDAWRAREDAAKKEMGGGDALPVPGIVTELRLALHKAAAAALTAADGGADAGTSVSLDVSTNDMLQQQQLQLQPGGLGFGYASGPGPRLNQLGPDVLAPGGGESAMADPWSIGPGNDETGLFAGGSGGGGAAFWGTVAWEMGGYGYGYGYGPW
ncbi:hypothetical protein F5Y17DRAFT_438870 [Xylariaceae sp. FL0594]|nr:hypothetical protein F5Y17DRAFT_438870 [Xylariaceae sp. FL0594]